MCDALHERLVAIQSTDELKRKQKKAKRKHYWTQEDIDCADRLAMEMYNDLFKNARNLPEAS